MGQSRTGLVWKISLPTSFKFLSRQGWELIYITRAEIGWGQPALNPSPLSSLIVNHTTFNWANITFFDTTVTTKVVAPYDICPFIGWEVTFTTHHQQPPIKYQLFLIWCHFYFIYICHDNREAWDENCCCFHIVAITTHQSELTISGVLWEANLLISYT